MNLPDGFCNNMKTILNKEYNEFIEALNKDNIKGIRLNTSKTNINDFLDKKIFNLNTIFWCNEGFFMKNYDKDRPGKHPYYHCGLFYIQEPSAMIPVEILSPQPGDKVLDLCAAPGGKTTQIANKMKGDGLIVSNDINAKRVKALEKNINLFGIKNSILLNESPENIKKRLSNYFDKILIDAPCSGEGMFKRDKNSISNWSLDYIKKLANIQRNILSNAAYMLKKGGLLVYSTCTFSLEENEGTIDWFIKNFPQFEILPIENISGLTDGKPELIEANVNIRNTKRAWPHKINGDGHFVALLRKKESLNEHIKINTNNYDLKLSEDENNLVQEFINENLNITFDKLIKVGNGVYSPAIEDRDLSGLKVKFNGLYLGELKKNRFVPSQHLAMSLKINEVKNIVNISSKDINSIKYLRGETIKEHHKKGWNLICIDNFPAGWAKGNNTFLKNYYKNSWRMM